jgi:hypothetical protein
VSKFSSKSHTSGNTAVQSGEHEANCPPICLLYLEMADSTLEEKKRRKSSLAKEKRKIEPLLFF